MKRIIVQDTGEQGTEIIRRITKAIKIYFLLSKKEFSNNSKLNMNRPVLTYVCKTWTVTIQQNCRVHTMEMKYLKVITQKDGVENEQINLTANNIEVIKWKQLNRWNIYTEWVIADKWSRLK